MLDKFTEKYNELFFYDFNWFDLRQRALSIRKQLKQDHGGYAPVNLMKKKKEIVLDSVRESPPSVGISACTVCVCVLLCTLELTCMAVMGNDAI